MEKETQSQENVISRRVFLEKAVKVATSAAGLRVSAGLGGASAIYGGYEALINASQIEKAEGEIVSKYRHLPRNVEIDTLRSTLGDATLPQGRRDYAVKVIKDADERDAKLKEIGSSGRSKVIGGLCVLGGAVLAFPHMLRRRQEILDK